ncbi:MAG: bifunctional adenosylcobinamide kinase/adenosylcobinamide-phosphate guanylyltransferase [Alphaproteobacteria bacterium]
MDSAAATRTVDRSLDRPLAPISLILGGARSGKSRYAESLISGPGLYLATATPGDAEMAHRIAAHRARRGPDWMTIEEPLDLVGAIDRHTLGGRPILVDCLTLWLSNLLLEGRDPEAASADLLKARASWRSPVVFVSNEVGLGIVPDNALARRFRDAAGHLNQALANISDFVAFLVAGLPMILKDTR